MEASEQQPPASMVALLRQLEAGFAAPCTELGDASLLQAVSVMVCDYGHRLRSSQEAAAFLR